MGGEGESLAELLPDGHAEQDVDLLELMDALERSLPPEEMTLALALAEGRTQEEIALESGRSRASVARSIAAMRGRLKRGGKNASAPRARAAR